MDSKEITTPCCEPTTNDGTSCCEPTPVASTNCCGGGNLDTAGLQSADELKALVKEKYGALARQADNGEASCCGGDGELSYSIMADEYDHLDGYAPDADLKLGCGLPTEFAKISKGDTVVYLGSGAGNDCFVARSEAGAEGQIIGVDFTQDMLMKARVNALKLGFNNVSFVQGDIENIPLPTEIADVVVSNCVFNLVPDKQKAFAETWRILKIGGHFSISDIVLEGDLPKALQKDAEFYAGCVSGAIQKEDYLGLLQKQGFKNITVQRKKTIDLPQDVLAKHLDAKQLKEFSKSFGIYSISVYGEK